MLLSLGSQNKLIDLEYACTRLLKIEHNILLGQNEKYIHVSKLSNECFGSLKTSYRKITISNET